MTAFLVSFVVSGLMSYVLVTLALNYRRARHERIQAPIAEALWAEGQELAAEIRRLSAGTE